MTAEVPGASPDVPGASPDRQASQPIAVVGLACRFPDAGDTAALLDVVLTGRRAFRRIPRARVELAEYYNPDPHVRDATYSTRAALLEGWRFDLAAFGISRTDFMSTDPAHWLALETAARALAAAGFPGGCGLPAERAGVFIGNTAAKDGAPAAALRLRWPYTRRVLADALVAAGIPQHAGRAVLAAAAERFLAPFPPVSARSLEGGSPASIATAICGRFGLLGGGLVADAGDASSLAAITTACLALASGQLDAAVAGGVDLSIDPYSLVALAKSGRLARADMRVYDASPTGFLPGEGCGAVLLMRTADARDAGLPIHAQIVGWGSASSGVPSQEAAPDGKSGQGAAETAGSLGPAASTRLLAMRRAHEMAGVEPGEVQLIEGCGAGYGPSDDAELAALAALRSSARQVAALGSVSANIGNAGAAAGAAGLIKAILAITNGVLPPSTGVRTPHPALREGRAALRLPATPEPWPAGTRHAGVAAAGPDGLAFHMLLRGEPGGHADASKAPQLRPRALPRAVQTRPPSGGRLRQARLRAKAPLPQNVTETALPLTPTHASGTYPAGPGHIFAFLLRAPDRAAMIKLLSRIALVAPWLSDAEMQDLAVHLARTAATRDGEPSGHEIRLALTAASQEQLAGLAKAARALVPAQPDAPLSIRPGICIAAGPVASIAQPAAAASEPAAAASEPAAAASEAAAAAAGRAGKARAAVGRAGVALVISGQPDELTDLPQRQLSRLLAIQRLLDDLGVEAVAAVGRGVGEVAGLVWAGCTTPAEARTLVALRSAALAAAADAAPGELASTIEKLGSFTFRRPRRRLISGCTGREVTEPDTVGELLCAELFEARLATDAGPSGSPGSARTGTQDAQAATAEAGLALGKTLGPAIRTATEDATLVVQTGQDRTLARVVAELGLGPVSDGGPGSPLPVVSIDGDPADDARIARVASALFAAGAMTKPDGLYARRPSRPIDIWRDPVFIAHPSQRPVRMPAPKRAEPAAGTPSSQAEDRPAKSANLRANVPAGGAIGPPEGTLGNSPVPDTSGPATSAPAASGSTASAGPAASAAPAASAGQTRAAGANTEGAVIGRDAGDPAAIHAGAGAKPWYRCYAERTQPPALPLPVGDDQPWRIYTGGCGSLDKKVRAVFRHDQAAPRALAVLGRMDDPATSRAAVLAASAAISTGQLVAISRGPGPAGLWASLHAEHPETGITVIRAPLTADGMAAAQRVAAAPAGAFRELVIGEDGTVTEPVHYPIDALGDGQFPLGPEDVVLISRGSGAAGLALAQVLACSGAAIAIVGRFHPAGDEQVVAGLEQLRGAGARIGYELVDLADHAALVAAVRRIEARYGCVTAIGHATGSLPRVVAANLTPQAVHGQVRAHTAPLDQLAAAARAVARSGSGTRQGRLRLIVTCGSVTSRYGLAGEAIGAFVTGALADFGAETAAGTPGCLAHHADWPAWSGEALGERADLTDAMALAGYAAMPVGEGSRLLLKALATDGLPGRLAIHGRVGVPAPRAISAAATSGTATSGPGTSSKRFIERVHVHYPGVELIAEARLSLLADPYLLDYQADGVPVLPPTMALEAMAQAAAVLAGAPVRRASNVTMQAPIVLPAALPASETVIRICALRDGDDVTASVRSDNSGFAVDHCRATFDLAVTAEEDEQPSGWEEAAAESLPVAEVYESPLFQAGRFRLLTGVLLTGSRSASAEAGPVAAASQPPWFGAVPPARTPSAGTELVLGDAALADAALQVVQAFVPDRRMLFAGCDSVWYSDAAATVATGPARILAVQVPAADESAAVPRPRSGSGDHAASGGPAWRIRIADGDGRTLISWNGLRMRDAGPLQQANPEETRQEPAELEAGELEPAGLGVPRLASAD